MIRVRAVLEFEFPEGTDMEILRARMRETFLFRRMEQLLGEDSMKSRRFETVEVFPLELPKGGMQDASIHPPK